MSITTPEELCVSMLCELRHAEERSQRIYDELGHAAQTPEIKEALTPRRSMSFQVVSTLDECFRLIGEKPVKVNERLHDVFIEDFRRGFNEIQSPVARKVFVLSKASHLVHLHVAGYLTLIEATNTLGQQGVSLLLESCLAEKLAFVERTKRLIGEQILESYLPDNSHLWKRRTG